MARRNKEPNIPLQVSCCVHGGFTGGNCRRPLRRATESLSFLAEQHSLEIAYHSTVPECQVKLDEQIFYRIVENIFSNAIRYAKSKVNFRGIWAWDWLQAVPLVRNTVEV